jgi:benzoate/toluate 1,2-dioxygenase beta subunit
VEAADERPNAPFDQAGAMKMSVGAQDPSVSSFYVSDSFYGDLIARFQDWDHDRHGIFDPVERDAFRLLLEREARFLDQHKYDDWLAMLTRECVYWAPARPGGGDPRTEIAMMFDDRRRLEDRVFRLRSEFAWSQAPASRTVRMISNVEVFEHGEKDRRMLRSNFIINEFWDNEIRQLVGWCGYDMQNMDGRWLIRAKQINLINCDRCIRNPSIFL